MAIGAIVALMMLLLPNCEPLDKIVRWLSCFHSHACQFGDANHQL